MRVDGTISSIDILRFVKSRYALDITHPEAVDVVRGLGGGIPCAEVVSSAVIKRKEQLKSKSKKKRGLWSSPEQQDEPESEIKSEIYDLPVVEYLDLVQIMSILMLPTFVKVGRRWRQSNQKSYVEVEDEDPNFTPIPGNLFADCIAGLVYDHEDKSLIPPENLISNVLRGFWRDMEHKGPLADNESIQEGIASRIFDNDRSLKPSASQRMGSSMMFEEKSTHCFTHDVESKQQEYDTTGKVYNTASAREEVTNAVSSETDAAAPQQHFKVNEGDDRIVSQQKSEMSSQDIYPARRRVDATVSYEENESSNGIEATSAVHQEGMAGLEETLVSRSTNGATAAVAPHQQVVVDDDETTPPCGAVEPDVPQQKSTIESSRRYEQWHNQEGTSPKRDPVGIDRTATFDEKKLEAANDGANARAGNDEPECPPECAVKEIPTASRPLSPEERKNSSLEGFHRASQAPSSDSSDGLDVSLPGMAHLPPKLTPALVKALLIANGEHERAKDTELVRRMIEVAQSSSGRFDEEALINAITSDLGAWGAEFEDRNTTYIYDSFGTEEAYSFQQSGQHIDSDHVIKRTTLEPIDSVIDSFASTFTVVIIWSFYICFSAIHISLSASTNSTEIDCKGLSSFWCTLINTIFKWYEYTRSIIIRFCLVPAAF